jgi:hypothetical protein
MKKYVSQPAAVMLLGALLASGCTWVEPQPGASAVTLVQPSHVANCKSIGTTVSQVKHKVGPFYRSEKKVVEELLTLARNSALDLGGDTLVAESGPIDGTQKFRIFKCK